MQYTLTITGTAEELEQLLQQKPAVAKEKPKAAKVAKPEVEETSKQETPENTITIEDIRALMQKVSDPAGANKRSEAMEIVKKLGGSKLKDVKPEDYPVLKSKLEEL